MAFLEHVHRGGETARAAARWWDRGGDRSLTEQKSNYTSKDCSLFCSSRGEEQPARAAALHMLLVIYTCLFSSIFLPHLLASTSCGGKCSSFDPTVRFPFWLGNQSNHYQHHHAAYCGSSGFELICNGQSQTILTHPTSGIGFIVHEINYFHQIVSINDSNKCLIKRFMDKEMDHMFSPFSYIRDFALYTFLNCSSEAKQVSTNPVISCLSNDNYKVIAVPSSSLSDNCSVITSAMVPIEPLDHGDPPNQYDWDNLNLGVQLIWKNIECHYCEASGRNCYLDNSGQVECASMKDLPKAVRIAIAVCTMISAILCVLGLTLKQTRIQNHQQTITELSTVIVRRIPSFTNGGLDSATIGSYPKTRVGESRELPDSGDSSCPICLGEYQLGEALRTIPQCNHYFHASCVDEWLRMNPTCPICRNPPEGQQNNLPID